MKKILIVLVGGTICTSVTDNIRSINTDAGTILTKSFYSNHPEYSSTLDLFEESKNFGILSENMTVDKWNILIEYFSSILNDIKKYSGIIIAHGTDTLAYSSSLFSILLKSINIPVFLVASNEPLSSPNANGNANFKVAVECILNGIYPGVYVSYMNPIDQQMYIHLGSRLKQCNHYDENFYSKGAIQANCITSSFIDKFNSSIQQIETTGYDDLLAEVYKTKLKSCVLLINPYVGLNYKAFDYKLFKAVFHSTYHSGTSCVEKAQSSLYYDEYSILSMIDSCDEKRVSVYYAPSLVTGEIYDTVPMIYNHTTPNGLKVNFIYGMTNEMTYIKLLVAYSLDMSENNIQNFLNSNISGEQTY